MALSQNQVQRKDEEDLRPTVDALISSGKACQSDQSAMMYTLPSSPDMDEFSILPPIIDPMQQLMLQFYLTDGEAYNASVVRMFKPTMKPYPYQERFRTALGLPSMFYSTIARATFYYLAKSDKTDTVHRLKIERCGIQLRSEAIRHLKESLAKPTFTQAELGDILAMTTSLATLEQLHGVRTEAEIHQHAARRVLELLDEPYTSGQQKGLLWYESILAPKNHSFFWHSSSIGDRAKELNVFIAEVAKKWKGGLIQQRYQDFRRCTGLPISPALDPNSRLYKFFSRPMDFPMRDNESNRRSHLFCVLLYAKTMVDLDSAPQTVYMYKSRVERLIEEKELDESAALVNLAWLMSTAVGVVVADDAKRRWQVAAMINVIKIMHHTYQDSIIEWFFQFIKGDRFQRALRIDPYAFSYTDLDAAEVQLMDSKSLERERRLQEISSTL